jgi:hypothetical protein
MKKRIVCTVTNDLNYDQRMIRICTSLTNAGYEVTLVGRMSRGSGASRGGRGSGGSLPLADRPFRQHRLNMWFGRGKLFYLEYQLRLLFWLLGQRMDAVCAIDLDSILPCYFVSRLRRIPRVYDAHELFCEMQEVVTRPYIYKVWKAVERYTVPAFRQGYTVNEQIAAEFRKLYGVEYAVIRNVPLLDASSPSRSALAEQGAEGLIRVILNREGLVIANTGREPQVPTAELFERFKKGNPGSDSIGIGLAIVRQICDISHFTIDYQYRSGLHLLAVGFNPKTTASKLLQNLSLPLQTITTLRP